MDEMAEWMVPMSTGQVEPHIAGRFSSIKVCSASAEVPLVLLSTSLISILSSVVAISVISRDAHHGLAPPFCLHPLPCEQLQPHSEPQTNNRSAQQPDRTTCCARRGGGRWAPARSSSDSGGGEGEKQIEVAALKSTGSRRPAHRSASTTRAAHRTPNSSAFYLQTGSASAVTALASPQLPVK